MSLRKPPTLTPALLAANRRNAQRSTGPRTEEGKRRVILNGLKHGLRSRDFRESLVKSGEGTALVDRNFLFLTLYLLPQRRYEVHRIAHFIRMLWSATRWGLCQRPLKSLMRKSEPAKPESLFEPATSDIAMRSPSPIPKREAKRPTAEVASSAIATEPSRNAEMNQQSRNVTCNQ